MRKLVLLVWIVQAFHARPLLAQEAPNPNAPPSERHEFVIANFKTESGVTLPQGHRRLPHLRPPQRRQRQRRPAARRTTWPTTTATNG